MEKHKSSLLQEHFVNDDDSSFENIKISDNKMGDKNIKNFYISGQEENVEKILSALKFISKIREGEKIDIKNLCISRQDIYSRLYRTIITREDRHDTYDFLKKLLNRAVEMIYFYIDNENKLNTNLAKTIIYNLQQAKRGMLNLTVTYEDDREFVTQIESLIEITDIKIDDKLIKHLDDKIPL